MGEMQKRVDACRKNATTSEKVVNDIGEITERIRISVCSKIWFEKGAEKDQNNRSVKEEATLK